MFENSREPVISKQAFLSRLGRHSLIAFAIIVLSLLLGVIGYHVFDNLNWTDSFLNAAMILGGMGPVDVLKTDGAKIFAGIYALYSGVVFLIAVGVVFAPVLHRFLHKFHLES